MKTMQSNSIVNEVDIKRIKTTIDKLQKRQAANKNSDSFNDEAFTEITNRENVSSEIAILKANPILANALKNINCQVEDKLIDKTIVALEKCIELLV